MRPRIPIILVTAYPDLLADEALPGPVLQKPIALAMLTRAIDTALGADIRHQATR